MTKSAAVKKDMYSMSEQPEDLLTPDAVCKKLGITQKTLCEWNIKHRHRAVLAPIRFSAKVVRYERQNVDAFIQKCRSQY